MGRKDLMTDPRYAGILFEIERLLNEADSLASARGVPLTDSNIRSLLVRAINEAKGKVSKVTDGAMSDKDRFLAEALQRLGMVRAAIVVEEEMPDGTVQQRPFPASEWIASLEAIKDSCALRTGNEPGSRGYLEFLSGFVRDAKSHQE